MQKHYPTGPISDLMRQIHGLQRLRRKSTSFFETLTDREVEVLALVARGMKNPAIAEELGISRTTVQNHRARLRDKLNVSDQTEYVKYALAYNLIQF